MQDQAEIIANIGKEKFQQATLLALEIKTGDFGRLKSQVRDFFKSNEIYKEHAPSYFPRSTEVYLAHLNDLKLFLQKNADRIASLHNEVDRHLSLFSLDPKGSYVVTDQGLKRSVKDSVASVLNGTDHRIIYGSDALSAISKEHLTGARHTPSATMGSELKKKRIELEAHMGSKHAEVIQKIEYFEERLRLRKSLKDRWKQTESSTRTIVGSFSTNSNTIRDFYAEKMAVYDGLTNRLAVLERDISEKRGSLASLTLDDAGKEVVSREIDLLEQNVAALRIQISGLSDVLQFCREKSTVLQAQEEKLKSWASEYQRADVLIEYFALGDDISLKLQQLSKWLRGGRQTHEAIGNLNFLFCFDAGVQAGFKLGIADLYARVGVTLVLGGGLTIVDDRRVMFTRRLHILLTTKGKASVGLPDEASGVIDSLGDMGIPLDTPEKLIDTSIQLGVSLLDEQLIDVYQDEDHWACRTAHEITRRILFLRAYDAALDEAGIDAQLQSLLNMSVSPSSDDTIKEMLYAKIEALKTINNKASKPSTRMNLSGEIRFQASDEIICAGNILHEKSASDAAKYGLNLEKVHLSGNKEVKTSEDKGEIHEELRVFQDSDIQGQLIFHTYKPDRNADQSVQYAELSQRVTNSATYPVVNVSWTSELNDPPTSPQELVAIAEALNLPVPTSASTAKLDAPAGLPDTIVSEMLYRAEIIRSGRGPNLVIEQLGKMPDRLEKGASYIDITGEKTGSDTVSSFSDPLRDAAGYIQPIIKDLDCKKSSCVYMRYIAQPRRDATGTTVKTFWIPQIFRGQVLQKVDIASGDQTIPIIPGLSAYFEVKLSFVREYSQYEVLGTDTFSYLRTLAQHMDSDISTASSTTTNGLKSYLKLHEREVEVILRNVTREDSGPHQELMFACSGPSSLQAITLGTMGYDPDKSRALGLACYKAYSPEERNPFVSVDRRKYLNARFAWAATAAASQIRNRDLLATLGEPQYLSERARRMRSIADRTEELANRYAFLSRQHEDLVIMFEAKFNESITRKLPPTNLREYELKLESVRKVYNSIDQLKKRIVNYLSQSLSIPESPTVADIRACVPNLLNCVSQTLSFIGSDANVTSFSGLPHIKNPDFIKFSYTITKQFGSLRTGAMSPASDYPSQTAAWSNDLKKIFDASFPNSTVYSLQGLLASNVPTPDAWEYDRGIAFRGFFQITSNETKELIKALNEYHQKIPALRRPTQFSPEVFSPLFGEYLEERYNNLDNLRSKILKWKGPKNQEVSKRMPNVVMLLEVPIMIEAMNLSVLAIRNELYMRMIELNKYKEWLENTSRLLPSIRGRLKPADQVDPIPNDVMTALLDFLRASPASFPHESLLHGSKQIRLPGSGHKTHEVEH